MTKSAKLVVSFVIAAVVFFFALRSRSYTRTMMVIFPGEWNAGQSHSCVVSGVDPASKLPQLNCDVASNDTAILIQDVQFSRRNKKEDNRILDMPENWRILGLQKLELTNAPFQRGRRTAIADILYSLTARAYPPGNHSKAADR